MGIVNAVNRLRDSKAKSKVIILLTDGVNNRGEVDPITASNIAEAIDVKIYTVGAGSQGTALYPVDDPLLGKRFVPMPVEIDEEVLKRIAANTNAKYFRATDTQKLSEIYLEIGELEKTKIDVKEFTQYEEYFYVFLITGLLFFMLEIVLGSTIFRKLP